MPTGQEYYDEWIEEGAGYGAFSRIARRHNVNESCVRKAVRLVELKRNVDPAVQQGMTATGLQDLVPHGGWVKSHEKDENGRTYSWYVKPRQDQEETEDKVAAIEERFRNIPGVRFEVPALPEGRVKRAFISINDLHAGALAWGQETGFGDWDLDIALDRLRTWVARLLALVKAEGVSEIILYYNGDTLHSNGNAPMTATQGTSHILDVDTRHFKAVDRTAEAIIHTADMAAQIADVRLVIKRGNHDEDSHLGLVQGAKWRYVDQKNVTVEMDPSPYWAYPFGKVLLFGHHGDKIKPETLILSMMQQHRKLFAVAEHVVMWTGDKHHRKVEQFPGVTWEQASCWTEADLYGSKWGNNAMAQAVVYDEEQGEVARFTVKEVLNAKG